MINSDFSLERMSHKLGDFKYFKHPSTIPDRKILGISACYGLLFYSIVVVPFIASLLRMSCISCFLYYDVVCCGTRGNANWAFASVKFGNDLW